MELIIHFTALPEKLTLDMVKSDLAELLEDDGWLTGSGADYLELELEDEKVNPKYGILTVKGYLQKGPVRPGHHHRAGRDAGGHLRISRGGYFLKKKSHRHFTDCLWRGPAGRGRADHRGGKRTTECPGSAWKGSSFLSREDAALWERLSRFWADVARQDAAALREWFAPEAEVYWHCTDERFTAEEYIRANCEYPGDWEGAVERAEWTEDGCVSVAAVWPKDRSARFHAVSFFPFRGGQDHPLR